ncbi:MAG TPA: AIR synthase-related protein [Holophagaceae bacterium]|nr:AIR synthase-related protein [Holophagaceae bacterium]
MPRPACPPQPTPAFRGAVQAQLGRDPSPLELEGVARWARAVADGEVLERTSDLPPHLGTQGALLAAFASDPEEAWLRLRTLGGSSLALLGTPDQADALEAFTLGVGLEAGPQGTLPVAFAAGCRSGSEAPPTEATRVVRLEGRAPEALGRGAQARALVGLPMLSADPATLVAWALDRQVALEVDLGSDPGLWALSLVSPERVEELAGHLGAWGLRAVTAGRLTGCGRIQIRAGARGEVDLPLALDPTGVPEPFAEGATAPAITSALPPDLNEGEVERTFHALRTSEGPRSRALGEAREGSESLALNAGSLPHLVALDPYWGAVATVAEASLGLACAGAEPLGLALALPREVPPGLLLGLRQAAVSLELPVLELERIEGLAAPVAVALGEFAPGAGPVDVEAPEARGLSGVAPRICGAAFRRAFDGLFLLGARRGELGGSRILDFRGGVDLCPEPWLDADFHLQACVREGVRLGLLRSAHALGRGGLLLAVLEGVRASGLGCQLFLGREGLRLDALCFGEAPGRVLVSVSAEGESALRTLARTHQVPLAKVGVVGGPHFTVAVDGAPLLEVALSELTD